MHHGNCQCKSVAYKFTGEPLTCYTCHCTDCQTSTGSAFTMSMIVNRSDLTIVSGAVAENVFLHNGTEVKRHHCKNCGSALWFSSDAAPEICALKPGTFKDTSWLKPVAHLWLRSAQPWVTLDDDAARYQTQPEIEELIELWRRSKYAWRGVNSAGY